MFESQKSKLQIQNDSISAQVLEMVYGSVGNRNHHLRKKVNQIGNSVKKIQIKGHKVVVEPLTIAKTCLKIQESRTELTGLTLLEEPFLGFLHSPALLG